MKSICLAVIIVALALIDAGAQPLSTNINPALLYYQAFLLAPDPMSDADMDYFYSKEGRGQKLPERFAKIFAEYDNQFALLRAAARSTAPCDWGIDVSEGPGTLLPHLAPCKAVAQAARLRVTWNLQQGRQTDARDDLLASFILGRNLTRNGTLIAALVEMASEAIDCSTVAENFGRFTPETLKELIDGLDAGPAWGSIAGCVPAARAFFEDWILQRILELQKANPGNDAKVMADLREQLACLWAPQEIDAKGRLSPSQTASSLGHDPDLDKWWVQLTQAAGGTSAGVVKLVRDMEPLYQRLALILALSHGEHERQMNQFKAELDQSPNPLFSINFPTWERARQREFKVQVLQAMVRAAVQYKLRGQAGFQAVNDPYGQGPFAFRRFVFEGEDRGFELTSVCTLSGWPEVMIFVEKEGPAFWVNGRPGHVGQALPSAGTRK